jgi:hypothetical protein
VSIAEDRKTIVLACKPTNKHFTFDHAAGEDSTQEELFEEVGKPVTQVINPSYNTLLANCSNGDLASGTAEAQLLSRCSVPQHALRLLTAIQCPSVTRSKLTKTATTLSATTTTYTSVHRPACRATMAQSSPTDRLALARHSQPLGPVQLWRML